MNLYQNPSAYDTGILVKAALTLTEHVFQPHGEIGDDKNDATHCYDLHEGETKRTYVRI